MNFLLRSLHWRTLLLTTAAILACEAVTFGAFVYFRNNYFTKRGDEYVSGYVAQVRTALQHANPAEVSKNLSETAHSQIRLIKDPPVPRPQPFREQDAIAADPLSNEAAPLQIDTGHIFQKWPIPHWFDLESGSTFPAELVRALNRKYGFGTVRHSAPPSEALWIRMHPDNWWLMIPAAGFEAPVPWGIIIAALTTLTIIVALVSLYVMQLSRPLRALAEAAGKFELGNRPQLPLIGPDEVRAVTAQFNKMADRLVESDAERRVMLAGLPHDLRAPLTRAKLRLELMDSPDQAETRAGLTRDFEEVENIAGQFVAYLRGLDGDKHAFEPTDVQALIRQRVERWRGTGQDVGYEVVEPCTFGLDRNALDRALDNLIGNALTHGAAPVRLRGIRQGDCYRIETDDHGRGIPSEMRAEALKPFARLDSARGGSGHCGLGLAVVQGVARLHNGRVELGDAPGGGLRAALVLPCGR